MAAGWPAQLTANAFNRPRQRASKSGNKVNCHGLFSGNKPTCQPLNAGYRGWVGCVWLVSVPRYDTIRYDTCAAQKL